MVDWLSTITCRELLVRKDFIIEETILEIPYPKSLCSKSLCHTFFKVFEMSNEHVFSMNLLSSPLLVMWVMTVRISAGSGRLKPVLFVAQEDVPQQRSYWLKFQKCLIMTMRRLISLYCDLTGFWKWIDTEKRNGIVKTQTFWRPGNMRSWECPW